MEWVICRIDRYLRPGDMHRGRRRDINRSTGVEINRRSQGELTQSLTYGGHQDLEDCLLVCELNLRLRRMNIDIDGLGVDVEIDKERGLVIRRKHTRISSEDGLLEIRMTHVPAVDEEILLSLAGSVLRLNHKAADGDQLRLGIHLYERRSIDIPLGIAEYRLDTLFLRSGG